MISIHQSISPSQIITGKYYSFSMAKVFNFIYRCNLANLGISLRTPQINSFYSLSFSISSSSSSSTSSLESKISETESSCTVNYLMNTCGFSQEQAVRASKYVKIIPDRADFVLEFLKNYGFTQSQISHVVKTRPNILQFDPEKTFMPKFEFLSSIGLSSTEIVRLITLTPDYLKTSFERKIIPSFNFIRSLFNSDEKTIQAIKRGPTLLSRYSHAIVVQNIQCLRELGVPEANVLRYMARKPTDFLMPCEKFREIVEEVQKLGFDPLRGNFVRAVEACGSMSKSLWEKKVEIYKKWGLSEEEIFMAFGKTPAFMMVSEKKIERIMVFVITKMGMKSSIFLRMSALITFSLEKRIAPRLLFRKILLDRGLINEEDFSITWWFKSSEKTFIDRIRKKYEDEAPQLLKLYMDTLK